MKLNHWLRQKLDIFELRVRAENTSEAAAANRDLYWCSGWAQGYKAAQRDARRASRADGVDVPALPQKAVDHAG
jgi:hypothetical protein